jgi:dipeptidase D
LVQEEEIGLNGAKALDGKALGLTGKRVINMDSEEWGEVTIGCAGGGHSTITLHVDCQKVGVGSAMVAVTVGGLLGGHSGLTIGEYRCGSICQWTTIALDGD